MKISLVVALSENNVMGRENQIPWHLPRDLKRFKSLTLGHWILMGRKTFESIGKALPGRTNSILTRDHHYQAPGCRIFHSLQEAIQMAQEEKERELFIIGGASIYAETLSLAEKIYLTRVHGDVEGDVFFPSINWEEWDIIEEEFHPGDERHLYPLTFYVYQKKRAEK